MNFFQLKVHELHSMKYHMRSIILQSYADDSQLQKTAPPPQIPDLLSMQKCIDDVDVKSWMTLNKLTLNDDKREAMIVSSGRMSQSLSSSFPDSVTVGSASAPLSDTMKTQVSRLVCSANFELCHISSTITYCPQMP